jgi:hypothetical protein
MICRYLGCQVMKGILNLEVLCSNPIRDGNFLKFSVPEFLGIDHECKRIYLDVIWKRFRGTTISFSSNRLKSVNALRRMLRKQEGSLWFNDTEFTGKTTSSQSIILWFQFMLLESLARLHAQTSHSLSGRPDDRYTWSGLPDTWWAHTLSGRPDRCSWNGPSIRSTWWAHILSGRPDQVYLSSGLPDSEWLASDDLEPVEITFHWFGNDLVTPIITLE